MAIELRLASDSQKRVCGRSLAAARFDAFDEDAQNALCYLIHAASLRAAAASDPSAHARFTSLLSLTDGRSSGGAAGVATQPGQIVQQMHAALGHAMGPLLGGEPLSLQEVAELLKKDELNGYGIDLPSADVSGWLGIRACLTGSCWTCCRTWLPCFHVTSS